MDISTLAPLVVTAVVPFLQKGAETIVDKAAEEGFEQRGKLWSLVKGLFTEDDLTLLNLFEQDPENVETQAELRGELKHLLRANPDITEKINELIANLKKLDELQPSAKNISKIENKDISNSFIVNDVKQS